MDLNDIFKKHLKLLLSNKVEYIYPMQLYSIVKLSVKICKFFFLAVVHMDNSHALTNWFVRVCVCVGGGVALQ